MASSLVLSNDIALIDESILESVGKKSGHIRNDNTNCEYFVINTTTQIQYLTTHHERLQNMLMICTASGYNYLVIIIR